ncbi:MAG TPA: helix-turn-helix transcriptional regulator [Puia sp.]|nr:helix-turn-helix transcriptional regulator [Puia sp.]
MTTETALIAYLAMPSHPKPYIPPLSAVRASPAISIPFTVPVFSASPAERFSALATEMRSYILSNLSHHDGRLGIDALARKFLKGRSTIKKIFRSNFRMPIHVFIVRTRMQLALGLLRENELPVSEIASRVGYAELSNFSRDFKTHFGYSPRVFRKR